MKPIPRLNYDHIAPQYNQRYDSSPPPERINALFELLQQVQARRILEVGCGTGFWLGLLAPSVEAACGLDYSLGMLVQARERPAPLRLSRGDAVHLPYQDSSFDLVYCVDAIHHFGDQPAFIAESFRVLSPGGALAVLGSDPHSGDDTWYVHDYFQGVLETDLLRFPSGSAILTWMQKACFHSMASKVVERISDMYLGKDVFSNPFLKKNSCSQLALLSDEDYQAGLEKIAAAIARDGPIAFRNELHIKMFTGFKPGVSS
jgi:ubiquinone/menaquinone biosynthesis C-methylase UbiE